MTGKKLAVLVLVLAASSLVRADEAPPRPRPKAPVANEAKAPLVVEHDLNAATPRLQIPRKLLAAQANPAPNPKDGPRGDAGRMSLPTIMAGLALTLAFACGGLWLVRRRHQTTASKPLLVAAVLLSGVVAAVWADVPSPRPRPLQETTRLSPLAIEIVDQGDEIRLVVNQVDWIKAQRPR